jgi:tetratricopeptide (TPR) repeat protein
MMTLRARAIILLAMTLVPEIVLAQAPAEHAHGPAEVPSEILERPLTLREGRGAVHERVSTTSTDAQAFYDQGLAYLHSYVWIEAARSFHQALRLDANLVMAYLGLSYAEWQLNRPVGAHAALARARALAAHASAREQRRIALRRQELDATERPRDTALQTAYRHALDNVLAADPSDVEVWLLRGLAEAPAPGDRGQGSVASSIPFYERALALAPDDFAAHHYLTHALENTGRIDEALAHGAAYAKRAPAIPHARHMHGHDLRRVGRIDEAIAEFQAAYDLELEYSRVERVPLDLDWHHQHNLDLLATSFQYVGRMKDAERMFRSSFAIRSVLIVQELNRGEWPLYLLSRRRWREAATAAATMVEHPSPIVSAMGHILAGRAALGAGRFAEGAAEANAALKLLKSTTQGAGLVTAPFEELQGEFFLRTGQLEKGRAVLEGVIRKVRALPGPDVWTQALFTLESISRTAREVGDWDFAGSVARQMLEHDPSYAGSHYAAALAARHIGDAVRARNEFALAEKYWNEADRGLPELQEARGLFRADPGNPGRR